METADETKERTGTMRKQAKTFAAAVLAVAAMSMCALAQWSKIPGAPFAVPDDGAISLHLADVSMDAKNSDETAAAAAQTPETPAFADVAPDAYYAGAVAWAVDQGITAGKTQTLFAPNETCTTAQILTFLWRANGSPEPAADNPFTDVEEDAYYSKAPAGHMRRNWCPAMYSLRMRPVPGDRRCCFCICWRAFRMLR